VGALLSIKLLVYKSLTHKLWHYHLVYHPLKLDFASMVKRWSFCFLAIALLSLPLASCDSGDAPPAPTAEGGSGQSAGANRPRRLAMIRSRGQLVCGVSGELPGFSFVDQQGNYAGLDVDICRAIAAALFDKPDAVEFRNLNAKERFTALQTGEIDILSRNTTLTMSRDTGLGLKFAPVVFYDGQGVMVRRDSGIKTLADLNGKSVCTQTGTTNEQNFTDQMRKLGLTYKPVVFEDVNTVFATYAQGRCDAITSDRSQLTSRKTKLPGAENNVILPEVLSKEPLAPAVAEGDSNWQSVVEWVIYALINGEELGLTSANVVEKAKSADPVIRRFLGTEGELGKGLGLPNDFALRVIKHVGNYGEVYDRNLGADTPLKLDRGLNNLWTKQGILYAPPFR
jgi:general L-amino acid transport system substrate-binding protein